jgi:release factor glutamine methyltransferase
MKISDLLSEAQSKLASPDARVESELLMEAICGISRSHQYSQFNDNLSEDLVQQYQYALQRRISGEPIAYITGSRGFWDMDLHVTPDVLIPRPDTECLVEQALERIPTNNCWQIADLGTGSGAIAIAIARERPQCEITATDRSMAALVIARENANLQGSENISFVAGSWGRPLETRRFNMIISNPPYIRSNDPHLRQGDLLAEPVDALVSGADGLEDIRQIIVDAQSLLEPGGWLLMEHGYDQATEISNFMRQADFFEVFTRQDYGGNDRVTGGRWPG